MTDLKKLIELDFPANLVTQPVLSKMIKKYDIVVNLRRASIGKDFGYIQMEIDGDDKEVKRALNDLTAQGVEVNPIEKDIVE